MVMPMTYEKLSFSFYTVVGLQFVNKQSVTNEWTLWINWTGSTAIPLSY